MLSCGSCMLSSSCSCTLSASIRVESSSGLTTAAPSVLLTVEVIAESGAKAACEDLSSGDVGSGTSVRSTRLGFRGGGIDFADIGFSALELFASVLDRDVFESLMVGGFCFCFVGSIVDSCSCLVSNVETNKHENQYGP